MKDGSTPTYTHTPDKQCLVPGFKHDLGKVKIASFNWSEENILCFSEHSLHPTATSLAPEAPDLNLVRICCVALVTKMTRRGPNLGKMTSDFLSVFPWPNPSSRHDESCGVGTGAPSEPARTWLPTSRVHGGANCCWSSWASPKPRLKREESVEQARQTTDLVDSGTQTREKDFTDICTAGSLDFDVELPLFQLVLLSEADESSLTYVEVSTEVLQLKAPFCCCRGNVTATAYRVFMRKPFGGFAARTSPACSGAAERRV